MRLRRPLRGNPTAAQFATRMRALGAIAHFDPSWGATDDGTTSQWIDCIGGTTCVSSSQATRLIYSASQSGLNSRPGWSCSQTNSTRLISTDGTLAALVDDAQATTIYVVKKTAAPGSTVAYLSFGNTAASSDHIYHGVTVSSSANKFIASRNSGGLQTTNTGSIIRPLTGATVTSIVYSGSAYSCWENGGPSSTNEANTKTPTNNRTCIGNLYQAGAITPTLGYDGVLGDIVIFAAAHTATERRLVEQLIAMKYGWAVLQGVSGFTIADYLKTANGAGIRGGNGVGVWTDALLRHDASNPGTEYIVSTYDATNGFSLVNPASSSNFFARNGTPGATSPSLTINANDIGKLVLQGGADDLSRVKSFHNGAENSAPGTALTGYSPAPAGVACWVGVPPIASNAAVSISLFGVAGGDVPQTAANQAGRAAAIKAAKAFVATGGATPTHGWALNSIASSYSDLVGTDALTLTGTLSAAQIIVPTWPW